MAGNLGKLCQEDNLGVFVLVVATSRLITGEAPRSGLLNPNADKPGSGQGLLRTTLNCG